VRRGFLRTSDLLPVLSVSPLRAGPNFTGGGAVQREHATVYGSRERGRVNGHTSERLVHDGSLNLYLDEGGDTRQEPEHARRERRGTQKIG